MKYAIVKIGGSQYLLNEGKKILVDKIKSNSLEYNLLMIRNNDSIEIGKPNLDKKLDLKITESFIKGQKIYPSKYKSKSRYRRRIGFRPQHSEIVLEKI